MVVFNRFNGMQRFKSSLSVIAISTLAVACSSGPSVNQAVSLPLLSKNSNVQAEPNQIRDWRGPIWWIPFYVVEASCQSDGTSFVMAGEKYEEGRKKLYIGCALPQYQGAGLHSRLAERITLPYETNSTMCPENKVQASFGLNNTGNVRLVMTCVGLAKEWTAMRIPNTSVHPVKHPFACPEGQYLRGQQIDSSTGNMAYYCGRPEPGENFRPPAPTGFKKISSTQNTITFGWNAVEGAQKYRVTRSDPYSGINLGETGATTLTVDAPAALRWYSIKSIVNGYESQKSDSILARP